MPKGVKSASLSSRSKRKGSALGRRLIAGLSEALAHAQGEIELPSYTVTVPDRVDVAKLDKMLNLTGESSDYVELQARAMRARGTASILPTWVL